MTLQEARQQFVDFLKTKNRSSATILAYGKDIEQLVQFLGKSGMTDPGSVSTQNLQEFMNTLSKDGYTPKSISRKTNSTKTFFKFLKSTGSSQSDPASGLEHPSFENKPPRILSKLEYRALRDASRADIRMSAIIELLLQTGVRIGELAKITVADLNLDSEPQTLHVRPDEGTTERTIPLNKAAVEALQRYLEIRTRNQTGQSNNISKALFVTKTGRPLLVRNIRTAIDRYFKLAGIEDAKVNDLRHTWVVHQLSSGISLTLVSKMAGHKRVSTTERYLQYVPSRTSEDKIKLEEL